jgi:hypothetical protein
MYDPPGYLWAITIAGIVAILAATCVVLYGGAGRAGLGRRRAALLTGGAAVVLGGWFTASAVIAGHGWYHTRLGCLVVQRVRHDRSGRGPDPQGRDCLPADPRHPSGAPISELPLALVPTVGVPLLFAVHITSVSALARAPRTPLTATAPLNAAAE